MKGFNAYHAIAMKVNMSYRTVRNAFRQKPVPPQTAQKIAKACGIPVEAFVIADDRRGLKK